MPTQDLPHVVIIGGGFAGLACARDLKKVKVRVTLIDARNHHLFQPLLYQVATAALSAPDIAAPIRKLLQRQQNATVLHRRVLTVDTHRKRVSFDGGELGYDHLIVAAGAVNHYYGHPEWEAWAPGLKTIDDAFEIRRRVLGAFEEAELEPDPVRRRELLTFAVVGAGATGVEMAGALSEIARRSLTKQFRHFDPEDARVVLVEGGPRVLNGFPEELCADAKRRLEKLGVEVRLNTRVELIDAHGVHTKEGLIAARTTIWAAGVAAEGLSRDLDCEIDRGGRVHINDNLQPHRADGTVVSSVMVCGDMAAFVQNEKTVPGVAPAALQMGHYAAAAIKRLLAGEPAKGFVYKDKGQLATIGRMAAVAGLGKRRLTGALAWFLWLIVHIMYLADFRNRIVVLFEWAWAWFSWSRPGRIILEKGPRWPPPEAPDVAPKNDVKTTG